MGKYDGIYIRFVWNVKSAVKQNGGDHRGRGGWVSRQWAEAEHAQPYSWKATISREQRNIVFSFYPLDKVWNQHSSVSEWIPCFTLQLADGDWSHITYSFQPLSSNFYIQTTQELLPLYIMTIFKSHYQTHYSKLQFFFCVAGLTQKHPPPLLQKLS